MHIKVLWRGCRIPNSGRGQGGSVHSPSGTGLERNRGQSGGLARGAQAGAQLGTRAGGGDRGPRRQEGTLRGELGSRERTRVVVGQEGTQAGGGGIRGPGDARQPGLGSGESGGDPGQGRERRLELGGTGAGQTGRDSGGRVGRGLLAGAQEGPRRWEETWAGV